MMASDHNDLHLLLSYVLLQLFLLSLLLLLLLMLILLSLKNLCGSLGLGLLATRTSSRMV